MSTVLVRTCANDLNVFFIAVERLKTFKWQQMGALPDRTFQNSEPENPSIDVSESRNISRSKDFPVKNV